MVRVSQLNYLKVQFGVYFNIIIYLNFILTAQWVQRLATGWAVRGSSPGGGEVLRMRPDRSWGSPSLLHNWYRVSSQGVMRPGRGVNHPPHLAPRLKKDYLYSPSGPTWPLLGRPLPFLPANFLNFGGLTSFAKPPHWRTTP